MGLAGEIMFCRARSFAVRPVVPALVCRRRGIVGCVNSGLDCIASEVSDLVRRAPFAFAPVSVVGETSGASGLSAVALVMLVSVG